MKKELKYIEFKNSNDNGLAIIGFVTLSKSGKSFYFADKLFQKSKGSYSNYVCIWPDPDTIYDDGVQRDRKYPVWVSGVKKRGSNRHHCGSGIIYLEKEAIDEFLILRSETKINASQYEVVDLHMLINRINDYVV